VGWHQAVVRGAIIPDEGLAIKILHTAARHGLPYIATDVLRVMKSAGIPFQEHHVAALLESFVVAGQVKDALFVVGMFSSESIDMTPETTHSLFKAISRNVDTVDEAYEHLEQLKRDGTKVSIAAFNAVISAAISLGDMQRAVGIYKAAEDLGVQTNVESLNALLSGCILLAHRALGDKLVLEAREVGIRPNAGTYERLIVLCLTQPTYEDAFFYLEEMKAQGFKPTYKVYDSLIRRTAKALDQRWELAWEELQQAGYPFSDDLREYIGSIKKRR
jgi:Pentatricopeptide repeat domain